MPLPHGTRVGTYEVLALLGVGGMGEVYRARDARLNREVALKVLPEQFALDPDRLARFRREAQVVASLNHPNIAGIHGFEEADGVHALVLELVEGPTLADRIGQGPIPLDDALPIARQIAEALEAAHERGIVHRDLKPANIKVRPDGTVKVLDFGLAKALEGEVAAADVSHSPTLTIAGTRVGMILGTAAYMAPEQARGKLVDKRADIWAFGCVLYEMLTAQRAFAGADVSDILASVLAREPELGALPSDTPQAIRRLIRRCLQKDRKDRLHDIADARLELQEAKTPPETQAPIAAAGAGTRTRLAYALVAACGIALGGVLTFGGMAFLQPPPDDAAAVSFTVAPPDGQIWAPAGNTTNLAVSPDGRRIALVTRSSDNVNHLWIRGLDTVAAQMLAGTDRATSPFWSPDSQSVGFFADGKLKRVSVTGGPPLTVCDALAPRGGTWNLDGVIVFGTADGSLQRVRATGGVPTSASMLGQGERGHHWPSFLPDGRHLLYGVSPAAASISVYVGSLDSADRTKLLDADAANVLYSQGHMLFLRESTLMAQPFDVFRLTLTAQPIPLVEQVQVQTATAGLPVVIGSASSAGTLVYRLGAVVPRSRLMWTDRMGKQLGALGDEARYADLELAPDGTQAAVSIVDPTRGDSDIWLYDVARGLRTRLTSDPAHDFMPVWSPDGDKIAFISARKGRQDLYQIAPSGRDTETVLWEDSVTKYANGWSPDGRFFLYTISEIPGANVYDALVLPMSEDRKPLPFLKTAFSEGYSKVSPDGRWVAYRSNESGSYELYVVPFPNPDKKWLVSTAGANFPRWRADGKEIFYVAPDNKLMAAAVNDQGASFEVGEVRPLFEIPPKPSVVSTFQGWRYDVSADGRRFLVDVPMGEAATPPLTVVLNWAAALRN